MKRTTMRIVWTWAAALLLPAFVWPQQAQPSAPAKSATTKTGAAKMKKAGRPGWTPVACDAACTSPQSVAVFDVDDFIDHNTDAPTCVSAKDRGTVLWQSKKYDFLILKVKEKHGGTGNPFNKTFPHPKKHEKNVAAEVKPGAAPPAGKCYEFKSSIQYKAADGSTKDKDPHIIIWP